MKPLKPKELSTGNLLNYDTGEGIELYVIDWQDLKLLEEKPELFNKLHTPVPLTPEILEGFGFVKDENILCLEINKNSLDYLTAHPEDGVGLYSHYGDAILLPEMKHAHTLQNFVQSISGVELVYNNKSEQK